MNAAAESGTALDIAELIEWYSYDTVFSISFGTSPLSKLLDFDLLRHN